MYDEQENFNQKVKLGLDNELEYLDRDVTNRLSAVRLDIQDNYQSSKKRGFGTFWLQPVWGAMMLFVAVALIIGGQLDYGEMGYENNTTRQGLQNALMDQQEERSAPMVSTIEVPQQVPIEPNSENTQRKEIDMYDWLSANFG